MVGIGTVQACDGPCVEGCQDVSVCGGECGVDSFQPLIFCRTKRLLCLMTTVKTWLVCKLLIGSTKDFRYVPCLGSYSQSSRFAYTQHVAYVVRNKQSCV